MNAVDDRRRSHACVGARWRQIARATVTAVVDDHCVGLAAQLAYYFLLALFPALLFLAAIAGYFPIQNAMNELLAIMGGVAPRALIELLAAQLQELERGKHAGLAMLGIAGAVWSSSAAMAAIVSALNHTYRVAEWRPWWKRRLVAIALTLALTVFASVSLFLIMAGSQVASLVAVWLGIGMVATPAWQVMRWPLAAVVIVLAIDLVYHFAPNRPQRWPWVTVGSVTATGLWILSSLVFRLYITQMGTYNVTYGAIGGVIVVLLWLYMSSLAILIGAELNSVITHSRDMESGSNDAPRVG